MASRDLLLDVTRLIWRTWSGTLPTGIDRVCLAYLSHYRPRAHAVVQWGPLRQVLSARHSAALFAALLAGGPGARQRMAAILTAGTLVPGPRDTRGWVYLNIGHTALDTPGLAGWLARKGLRPIFLVHDLIPITHPEFCRAGEPAKHRRRMRLVLDSAAGVIANSAVTQDELASFAQAENRAMPAALVAWLGIDTPEPQPQPAPSTRPRFVAIGTIEARKNHLLLLHLWERLADQMGSATPELVLVGQRGWEADDVFAMLDRSPRLKGHVRELGDCDDAALIGWLRGARALLMPSFVEGFGIPVIEALQHGTPVIAADLPVYREIVGDIPRFLDPLDGQGWQQAVRDYLDDSADRQRQITALATYRAPTWQDHFAKVDKWLASL